ncbi:hypothetical protein VNI00_006627 [Paramarasmius palmivorus]|uniref:Uncharacterized protein n=1 Tax=Paramarasmius palmivorus TaxID=297713 RepID=A0AAW0D9Z8_9AGAR
MPNSTTETAMQNLFDIAWTQKDRDKLYTPVLNTHGQQETQTIKLKCMFTFTPGQPKYIIIRREYYQALQDAISFFHGVGQFYTRYTKEDRESEWGMLIDKMEKKETEDKIPVIDWEIGKEIKNRHQVFFVTGSSGIGKTLWLYFVLIERLLLNLPTYFQTNHNYVSFWSQDGVQHLSTTDLSTQIPQDIWYLFDSNPDSDVINPPREVQESNCRIVVAATSSPGSRFKWADKLVNTDYKWNMKPTSVREVVTMNPYQEEAIPIDDERFTELFGTCARHVFKYAQKINTYRQELQTTLRAMTLDGFRELVQLPDPNNRIVGIYPGPTRDDPYVFIHTSEILRMVQQRFGAEWDRGVWGLFDAFRRDDDTRAVAGRILEDRIHEVLAGGGRWRGVELAMGGENSRRQVWLSLGPGAEISTSEPRASEAALDVRRFRSGEEEDLTTGYYRGSQTQDSFVLDVERKTMVVIQSTRQDVKKTDLEFEERWQQLRIQAGYRVYYVLITTDDDPETISKSGYERIIHICMSKKDLFPNAPAGSSSESSLRVWGYKPSK